MAAKRTFDKLRPRARELYDEGYSCNAIAKQLGCSPSTVSLWAKDEGLKFDRSQTALAVRAHVIDMAESRLLLTKKMLAVGHEALDKLDGPYLVYAFGGKENDYNEHTLDSPPLDAIKTAQMIAKEAFMASSKALEQTPEGLRGAESLIDRLEAGLSKFDDGGEDDLVG